MIGKLRHRITIEQPTRTEDGAGGFTEAWSALATVSAEVMPLSGRERLFAGKLEQATTHRVVIRHRADIQPKMRVSFRGRTLHIQGVINREERSRWLELLCAEGVGS